MNLHRFAISLLGTLLISWNASGETNVYTSTAVTEEMLFADDPKDWAKPKVVVPPEFPGDQLAANTRGYVDVEVELNQNGSVKTARIVKSEPQNTGFEKAVLEVVKLWLFHAALNNGCVPRESTGNARIWFEVRDGKGVVSISGNVTATAVPMNSPQRTVEWENRQETLASLGYPVTARLEGVQANLFAAVRIDAATGIVTDAAVTWIETLRYASGRVTESFKIAAVKSLKLAKFKPREGKDYSVCVPFTFRLR